MLSTLPGTMSHTMLASVISKIKSFHLEKNYGWKQVKPVVQSPKPGSLAGSFQLVVLACSNPACALHFSAKVLSLFLKGMFTLTPPLTRGQEASEILGKHPSYKLEKTTELNGDDTGGQVSHTVSQTLSKLQSSKMLWSQFCQLQVGSLSSVLCSDNSVLCSDNSGLRYNIITVTSVYLARSLKVLRAAYSKSSTNVDY